MRTRAPRVAPVLALVVAVALAAAGYLGWTAVQARAQLEQARTDVVALQSLLAGAEVTGAHTLLQQLQGHTRQARRLTSGPVWRAAGAVPFAGRSLRSASGIATATDELARTVLPPLLRSADEFTQAASGAGPDVDVDALARLALPLHDGAREATRVRDMVAALPDQLLLAPVARAHTELLAGLDQRLVPQLESMAKAADIVPGMLGTDGPRRYFVALQNTAEARGTGGLVGVYAVVVADRGRFRLERAGDANELLAHQGPHVDLGAEHAARYGMYGQASPWLSANLSPHFPYAGRTWSQLWQAQTGQRVDGVVAVDADVLDHLLAGIGPVTLPDGTALAAGQAVALTQEHAYVRYPEVIGRKQFLSAVVEAVFGELTRGQFARRPLLTALGHAVREGRVKVYSTHDEEQQVLEGSPVGGALPRTTRPFVLAAVNNAFGNKLDYYLDRHVEYELGRCAVGQRDSRIAVRLSNTAPLGLVDYVTGRVEAARRGQLHAEAHHRVLLSVFTTAGARLRAATLDGQPVTVRSSSERGHPVFDLYVELPRAETRVLVLNLMEPASEEPPLVMHQALVRDQTGRASASPCREQAG